MPNIQYIASSKSVGGQVEIRLRFYTTDINQRAATAIFVPALLWNNTLQRCTINKRYNTPDNQKAIQAQRQLDQLTAYIYERYALDALNITAGWLRSVVADFHNPQAADPPLHEQITDYCNARNVAPATRKKMQVLGNHLQRFADEQYPLYAATLTSKDLDRFAAFLHYKDGLQTMSQNAVNCRLRQLRTLVYWAGKPHPNPFDGYKIQADVYGTPIYLTKDEREYLYLYNDFTPKKTIQRDIFIFQCHTGCRVSDLYALTPANISNGWLVYVQQKTSRHNPQTIEIPLSKTAQEIAAKYKDKDPLGRLFPFIAEQKYNESIQEICKQACLDRSVMILDPRTFKTQAVPLWSVVSSHTARKTFAQILYTETHDKRLVAALTGHSENSQAFNRYSEISREMKARAAAAKQAAEEEKKALEIYQAQLDEMARRRRTDRENTIYDLEQKRDKELQIAKLTADERLEIEEYYAAEIAKRRQEWADADAQAEAEAIKKKAEARAAALVEFGLSPEQTDEEAELAALQEAYNNRLLTDEEYEWAKAEITRKYANERVQIQQDEIDKATKLQQQSLKAIGKSTTQAMSALSDMFGMFAEESEEAAAAQKAFALMNIITNQAMSIASGARALSEAVASGAGVPFPANIAAIASGIAAVTSIITSVASTIAQAKQIFSQANTQKFANGGIVGGNSYSGDNVPAMVNSGEMILNQQQQGRLFELANSAANYGAAGNYETMRLAMSDALQNMPAPILEYQEFTNFQNRVTTIKELTTI